MKRILIVDDEPDILKVMRFRLTQRGYEIATAVNGQEGLERAKEFKPDLILADIVMPKMKGDELCRRIKADPATRHMAVIIMTASIIGQTPEAIHKIKADGFILKPFEPQELFEKIKDLIG